MIDWVLSKELFDNNKALSIAAKLNDTWLIEYLVEKGANDWQNALYSAIDSDSIDAVEIIYEYLKEDPNAQITPKLMRKAGQGSFLDIVAHFLQVEKYKNLWIYAFQGCCDRGAGSADIAGEALSYAPFLNGNL